MANYATLISAIQSVIAANGNNEITGPILQQTLVAIVDALGAGYQYLGVANPSTNPGTPDQRVFYLAGPGVYSNFGPTTIADNQIGVFKFASSWTVELLQFPIADGSVTTPKIADGNVTIEKLSTQVVNLLNELTLANNDNYDLDIADNNGNVLARFYNGHFRTKFFNSVDAITRSIIDVVGNSVSDLDIKDEDNNTLVRFANGHIRTLRFDSSKLPISAINKAVFMGDSITQGVYSYWNGGVHTDANRYNGFDISNPSNVAESTAYHGIHYYFGLLSVAEMVNLGKRGTGWVTDPRNLGNALAVANGYNFSDVDFVALCFGVNDYIQGVTIGDISTQASGTLIGNMCATIEKILTDNPLCKVVVYSPYNTWGQVSKGGDYTANTFYGDESTNYALGHQISGRTLQDIIDAMQSVCNHYGIQCVDLSKSNVVNRYTLKNIMVDGLHPTKESYIKLAAEIYGKGNFGA